MLRYILHINTLIFHKQYSSYKLLFIKDSVRNSFWSYYSAIWELGTPKGLSKTVLNSEVVLFLRFIFT